MELRSLYKSQIGIEKNFGFLKNPVIVNIIFLKNAKRIEFLGFVLLSIKKHIFKDVGNDSPDTCSHKLILCSYRLFDKFRALVSGYQFNIYSLIVEKKSDFFRFQKLRLLLETQAL